MERILVCAACRGKFRIEASAAPGSLVRCPHCCQVVSVPGPVTPRAAQPAGSGSRPVSLGSRPTGLGSQPASNPRRSTLSNPLGSPRRKTQNRTLVYVIGASGGVVVLLLVVLIGLLLSGRRDVAANPDETNAWAVPAAPDDETASETSLPESRTSDSSAAKSLLDFSTPLLGGDEPESAEPTAFGASAPQSASSDSAADVGSSSGLSDMLARIDPDRDAVGVKWTREGSSLNCPGGARWALVVPEAPPAGYEWTVVVEPKSNDPINLCLVVDNQQVMVILDSYGQHVNGLSLVGGRTADANETTREREVFQRGRATTIVCTVNRSRVHVTCDGERVVEWKGSAQRLSLDRTVWQDLPADRLAVTCYGGGPARIGRMEIKEIDPGTSIPYSDPRTMADGRSRIPPWARPWTPGPGGPPQPQPFEPQPSLHEEEKQPSGDVASTGPIPTISLGELPDAVRRSKESVCIIEHPLGSGTGFVVGPNLVATNAHVVDGAYVDELECHFSAAGAQKYRASRVLFEDPVRDLCLLEVKSDQAPIPIVESHVFSRGEKVVIVGNPSLGETDIVLRDAVTAGTIRAVVHTGNCDFYQIDGVVNPGSSGGPAMNYDGAVVAVIAMKATEQGESEIRQALRGLDDSFAGRFGAVAQKGIAFGIPVLDLSRAIAQVQSQSESDVNRVSDRHLANVLVDRMSFVAGISLIRLQMNVPAGVRQQAETIETRIRMGQVPSSTLNRIPRIPLIPQRAARALNAAFEEKDFRKILRASESNMEANVKHLSESQEFDRSIASNFEALLRAVQQTRRSAEKPPTVYNAYAKAVNEQAEEMKNLIRRLKDQLSAGKAAYEG